jgi:hypothetical protein
MAITKLSITGNTTSVGISTTPVEIMLVKTTATGVPVTPNDNITTTNVQAALEQLDDIKAQATNGTLTNPTISGSASFGDNDKVKFGAGNDLQIYHDGSNSYVSDTGYGNLILRGNSNVQIEGANGENCAIFNENSSVRLFHDNAEKLETTSTGIDVTGTATMDGLTVDGSGVSTLSNIGYLGDNTGSVQYTLRSSDAGTGTIDFGDSSDVNIGRIQYIHASNAMTLRTNNTERMRIDSSGNVGIGTTSPAAVLDVECAGGSGGRVRFGGTTTSAYSTHINVTNTGMELWAQSNVRGITFSTGTTQTERMRIDSSGNVGIGTTSPAQELHVVSSGESDIRLQGSNSANHLDIFHNASDFGLWGTGTQQLKLATNNAERMRIDSSGNVRIGTVLPQTSAKFNLRRNGTNIEFGHGNRASGYYGTLGAQFNNGQPYMGFSCDADDSGNTFTTRGFKGNALIGTTTGDLTFNQLTSASASGQTPSERMRIDASGNLLVGTTDNNVSNNTGTANSGINLLATGQIFAAYGGNTANFNRLGSDGGIINFDKDGTTVGSIGTASGDLNINGGANHSGIRFQATGLYPLENGTVSSGEIDLGAEGSKFKNLYLSGGVRGNNLTFSGDGSSEHARIDTSGNLLVGQTSTGDYTTTAGSSLRASGFSTHTRDGGDVLLLNRLTSDGTILQFRKDNATVGSIGTKSTRPYFASTGSGVRIGGASILPCNSSGTTTNNTMDIGLPNEAFKDLHLSGGIKGNTLTLSGNGSSEHARIDSSGNVLVGSTSQFTGGSKASTTVTVDGSVGRKGNRFDDFDDVWSSEDAVIIEGVSNFNPSNSPNAENWYFVKAVTISTGSSNIYCTQTVTTLTGRIFTRYNNDVVGSGSWTSWVEK